MLTNGFGSQKAQRSGKIVGMERRDLEPTENNELTGNPEESQPPLVIDLPDGQKLLVGDLDPGTVIEVATWRGTERPDSRTNRLMLGVSTNEAEGIPKKRSLPKSAKSNPVQDQQHNLIYQPLNSIEDQSRAQSEDSHLESKQISTGIVYTNINPESRSSQLVKKHTKGEKSKSKDKILRWGLSTAIITLLAFIILVVLGLRFAHPVAGVGTSLGGASSAIAVVKSQANYKSGDVVISDSPQNQPTPVMAVVDSINDRTISLSTESDNFEVRLDQLHGKVIAILPFIGQIANWLGK
jgi:hypothetical protein